MSIARVNTCYNCKHVNLLQGSPMVLDCRRFPPQVGLLPMPGDQPGVIRVEFPGAFPRVQPDNWCGEHAPKITVERFMP